MWNPTVEISYSPSAPLLHTHHFLLLIVCSTLALKEAPAGSSILLRPLFLPLSQSVTSQLTFRVSFFHLEFWGLPPTRIGSLEVQLRSSADPGVASAWLTSPPPPAGSLWRNRPAGTINWKRSATNEWHHCFKIPTWSSRSQSGTFRNILSHICDVQACKHIKNQFCGQSLVD